LKRGTFSVPSLKAWLFFPPAIIKTPISHTLIKFTSQVKSYNPYDSQPYFSYHFIDTINLINCQTYSFIEIATNSIVCDSRIYYLKNGINN
jgi:hypothetical protein